MTICPRETVFEVAGASSLGADCLEVEEECCSPSELSAGMGLVGVRLPASSKPRILFLRLECGLHSLQLGGGGGIAFRALCRPLPGVDH